MSTSKTEVEVIVFVAIMLHKVDNDFYFLFLLLIFYMYIKKNINYKTIFGTGNCNGSNEHIFCRHQLHLVFQRFFFMK